MGEYIPKTHSKENKTAQIGGWDGNNSSGFAGLPGGCRSSNGSFMNGDANGYWWTSKRNEFDVGSWSRMLSTNQDVISLAYYDDHHGFSVRCVKD